MNKKIKKAVIEVNKLLEKYPHHYPFKMLKEQLLFALNYIDGKTHDLNILRKTDIGQLAAKEVTDVNIKLAEDLAAIAAEIEKLCDKSFNE